MTMPPGQPGPMPQPGMPPMPQQQPMPQQLAGQPGPLAGVALPDSAMARLAQLRPGAPGAIFTSDLSVAEFLLVRQAGFRPLGMVMGTSIYHVGIQFGNWSQNMELPTLTQAVYNARHLAMSRMQAEADQLGADGVVGVALTVRTGLMEHAAEFVAFGTAVKADDNGRWRDNQNRPFTSVLTGQEFWTLLQSGYAPVGLVMGACVYHVAHRSMRQIFAQLGQNAELPQLTQALYDARELAMDRMQREAEALRAEGVVGVEIIEEGYGWSGNAVEYLSLGTAVRPPARRPLRPRAEAGAGSESMKPAGHPFGRSPQWATQSRLRRTRRPGEVEPMGEPDTDRPDAYRIYDYLLGGSFNFAADRAFARDLLDTLPWAREVARHNRAFLSRAVRFAAGSGVRQFLDLGSGIPTASRTDEIARAVDASCRTAYVDDNPIAVAHAEVLLDGDDHAQAVRADLRDPAGVLDLPAVTDLLDLSRPVALVVGAVLHFVPDADEPARILAYYRERLVPGSLLVLSHLTHERVPDEVAKAVLQYRQGTSPVFDRARAEITALFDGWELLDPGVVFTVQWRPDHTEQSFDDATRAALLAGVGRR
jgi:uncharacterized protein YbjQ (UPF0145 family)